jgi:hypothetical protein
VIDENILFFSMSDKQDESQSAAGPILSGQLSAEQIQMLREQLGLGSSGDPKVNIPKKRKVRDLEDFSGDSEDDLARKDDQGDKFLDEEFPESIEREAELILQAAAIDPSHGRILKQFMNSTSAKLSSTLLEAFDRDDDIESAVTSGQVIYHASTDNKLKAINQGVLNSMKPLVEWSKGRQMPI